MSLRKTRLKRTLRNCKYKPAMEGLEARLVPSTSWNNFNGNPQHTGISTVAAGPMDQILWSASIDQSPAGAEHYGEPVFTPSNTVLMPIRTASGGYQVEGLSATNGQVLWTAQTDYVEPSYSWLPPFQIVYDGVNNRVYFAGANGSIFYVNNPDNPGSSTPASTRLAFYGTYSSADTSLYINTPLTVDNSGNVFFGFTVSGSNLPSGVTQGGIARISSTGVGSYILASVAADNNGQFNSGVNQAALGSAPALSNDGTTLYVALNNSSNSYDGYLVGVNAATMAAQYSVPLIDPDSGNSAGVIRESTAAPMVAPDNSVFFGVFGNPYNGSRGFMLHFSANLGSEYTPGAFGWDDTASIIPSSMVSGYTGGSSYLILTKYNNYADPGAPASYYFGDGVNDIAILDPNASQPDPNNDPNPNIQVMKQVVLMPSPTPDVPYEQQGYPDAVREWCTNGTVVDPATDSVFINNEDGYAYRWNLGNDTLTQAVEITDGIGEPYTPTAIGPNGTVYAINGGTLFALGGYANYTFSLYGDVLPVVVGNSVTFTASVASTNGGPAPTGTVTFTYTEGANTPMNSTPILLGTFPIVAGAGACGTTVSLPAGHYHVTATYSGDSNYPGSGSTGPTVVQTILESTSVAITSTVPNAALGQSVTFTATLTPGGTSFVPMGTVTFTAENPNSLPIALGTVNLNSALQATVTTSSLPVGNWAITCTYSGDANFAGSYSPVFTETVNGTMTTLASSVNPSIFGQNVTYTATVSSLVNSNTPVGTVTFMEGNTTLGTGTLSGGTASLTTMPPGAVNNPITAIYGGDSNDAGSTTTFSQVVNPASTTTTVAPTSVAEFGQYVVLSATVTGNSPSTAIATTGSVTFYDNGNAIGTTTTNPGASFQIEVTFSVGSHTITASYSGDNFDFLPSPISAGVTQTVNEANTSTQVFPSAASVFGQSVTLSAVVKPDFTGTPNSGIVTFFDGGVQIGTGTVSNGMASCSTSSLSVGSHTITASYGGDGVDFLASPVSPAVGQTVNEANTSTGLAATVASVFGQSVTFTATVSVNSPGAGTPGSGTVTFFDSGKQIGTGTVSGGVATFSTSSLSVGSHPITASYGGDGIDFANSPISASVTQVVTKDSSTTAISSSANPSVNGQTVTITATVTANSPGSGTPAGTVTFKLNGVAQPAVKLNAGQAVFVFSPTLGAYNLTATYNGGSGFTFSNSLNLQQVVNKDGTTTTLASSANPSVNGQIVTFTATVVAKSPGSGIPAGMVTFKVNGTAQPPVKLNAQGQAAFSFSPTVGTYSVTSSYGGGADFTISASSPLSQVVNKDAVMVALVSSLNPSTFGQPVTFTATVSAAVPGSGTPTGTVEFFDGTTVLGFRTLTAGRATFKISTLSVGSHSITAKYLGDADFNVNTSSVLTETVNSGGAVAALLADLVASPLAKKHIDWMFSG